MTACRTIISSFTILFAAISKKSRYMQLIFGIIFHFIGGFASGSFYMPFKKVKKWAWESYWIIGGLFSWLIIPPLAAYLTVPHFMEIVTGATSSTFWWTYFWGILWG